MKRAASMIPSHQLSTEFAGNSKRRMSLAPGKLMLAKKSSAQEVPALQKQVTALTQEDHDPMERLNDLEDEDLDDKLLEFRGVAGQLDG